MSEIRNRFRKAERLASFLRAHGTAVGPLSHVVENLGDTDWRWIAKQAGEQEPSPACRQLVALILEHDEALVSSS